MEGQKVCDIRDAVLGVAEHQNVLCLVCKELGYESEEGLHLVFAGDSEAQLPPIRRPRLLLLGDGAGRDLDRLGHVCRDERLDRMCDRQAEDDSLGSGPQILEEGAHGIQP